MKRLSDSDAADMWVSSFLRDTRAVPSTCRGLGIVLGSLQLSIGVGAFPAGLLMILDPSGARIGLPLAILMNTPFRTFLVPGVVLLSVNGVLSALGGILSLKQKEYSGVMAIGLGLFLVLWIAAQVYWMGTHWLHFVYLAAGGLEVFLGILFQLVRSGTTA